MKGYLTFLIVLLFSLTNAIGKSHKSVSPVLKKTLFYDTCKSPQYGKAKVLVDTDGVVRKVIILKCEQTNLNYFYNNLFKLEFEPAQMDSHRVACWIILNLKFCYDSTSKPIQTEHAITNIRVIKRP